MSRPRYLWRQLDDAHRRSLLDWRVERGYPWHSPPHRPNFGHLRFLVSAACYDHRLHIGHSLERMERFACELLAVLREHAAQTYAWVLLPNHYHVLVEAPDVLRLLSQLGKLHGRSSFSWNGEEHTRGRKVFFRAVERVMRSDRHFFATLNYVHHNPVRHRYVERWTDWPWSSAGQFLAATGREEARRIWQTYPLMDYGEGWDAPEM
jgi:putative transposase